MGKFNNVTFSSLPESLTQAERPPSKDMHDKDTHRKTHISIHVQNRRQHDGKQRLPGMPVFYFDFVF